MSDEWVPVSAAVEWHSGRRGLERPARVALAGGPVELTVESQWVEGPAAAGEPLTRWFVTAGPGGRRYRIALRGDASVTVEIARPG